MLPARLHPAAEPPQPGSQRRRLHPNTPEEDDETMSTEERAAGGAHEPGHAPFCSDPSYSYPPGGAGSCWYQPPGRLPAGYSHPTPFPSRADGAWQHPSFASGGSAFPGSREDGGASGVRFGSPPGRRSPSLSSLEPPLSLCSDPPSGNMYHHTLPPYSCSPQGAPCCACCPPDGFNGGPAGAWPQYHPAYGVFRLPASGVSHRCVAPAKEKPPHSAPLSLEQRRVFVTYEADDDKHVNEIINFVALLRHNGFDTHIDIFEQQFRSISKIDFMERYLSEKEYLIIIIISPKYYETVTASPVGLENDERTFNTVYIHKQLQNEFIQNGSKNFRFIPVVFPRAKKCHVPNWLQNTHVYEWPLHRDDILRRLMRVEKYVSPPIGALPTIVSIPI
ncbi:uncharacterized protein traf3ip2l [Pseudoliparis swirei]|uniref:uncharacterized protein traf3ip2l n=1 Tax=Pseudoliparis swirei TaxID=2059687 RepID=UPI0024BD8A0F|nr:uncharacterized protein traf3ip2l [Pseudoliparis swirei]XP_056269948.1 uncharacterized protein traf3ip2l [Pseudoliparis swirei]